MGSEKNQEMGSLERLPCLHDGNVGWSNFVYIQCFRKENTKVF